jgi:hypothetical protein
MPLSFNDTVLNGIPASQHRCHRRTIAACRLPARMLRDQRRTVLNENLAAVGGLALAAVARHGITIIEMRMWPRVELDSRPESARSLRFPPPFVGS